MKTPLKQKIINFFRNIVMKLAGHEYGCCSCFTKRCAKCVYVLNDKKNAPNFWEEYSND